MILFPAIDLKDGACVRLLRGEMDQATVFNTSPADQARRFAEAGCAWLHVVDLNGAFAGRPVNRDAVALILAAVSVPIQLGGGIRDLDTIEAWLDQGIRRVILGTVALRDPGLVKEACRRHPGRIAVGIDARAGLVAVEGWAETSQMTAVELALRYEDLGVAAIIHTDIDRDGVMAGPNIAATAALAERLTTPVIVSGGVSCLDDLRRIKAAGPSGIIGAIAGRALYDGRIELADALTALA
ncbi:MAG: 1-(5-phosphoribosyl)-5-[(5-phosphoribosylamino)methylideneamino]imidazole-4-carboxamide isomerase [Alphaproteobacteria bacterium]|nr:1-(5-phosphoribosyl)-5-[(5-phosphoribosylamino)methylideneamino]imidazole-4-carboxamide isomerase [Alphaproteobacteria bacterium]